MSKHKGRKKGRNLTSLHKERAARSRSWRKPPSHTREGGGFGPQMVDNPLREQVDPLTHIAHETESGWSGYKDLLANSHFPNPLAKEHWTATTSPEPFPASGKPELPPEPKKHKEKAPTLADMMIREAFKPEFVRMVDPHNKFRQTMAAARKFVLNKEMSAFMADLANGPIQNMKSEMRNKIINGWRRLARAPHHLTWIEYDQHFKNERCRDAYPECLPTRPDPSHFEPRRIGWLIHQVSETNFTALECCSVSFNDKGEQSPNSQATPSVFEMCWSTQDDTPLEWAEQRRGIDNLPEAEQARLDSNTQTTAQILTGNRDFIAPQDTVGVILNRYMPPEHAALMFRHSKYNPLTELSGDLRYLWVLLATINDLPTHIERVTASKGFVARGQYRKFSDHSVITLNIPQKEYRQAAKKAAAIAHKRAHMVRGHWRKNFRKPGERFWIKEHQRGDASLGFVLHDYSVTHETQEDTRSG